MIDLAIAVYLIGFLLKLSEVLKYIIHGYWIIGGFLAILVGITHFFTVGETKEYTILFLKTLKK